MLDDALSKIALRDEAYIDSVSRRGSGAAELDARTCELIRLGTLIGIEGTLPSYVATVQAAQEAGASDAEIVDAVVAVLPSAGVVRTSAAASKVALALGYEPNAALLESELERPIRDS